MSSLLSLDGDAYEYGLQSRKYDETLYSSDSSRDYHNANVGFGIGVASLFASGFIPTGQDKRLWDKYVPAIRAAEEYSPGAILRTLQISSFLSQFERVAEEIRITPSQILENPNLHKYVAKLIGPETYAKNFGRLTTEGVVLKNGSLYWEGGETALKYASALKVPIVDSADDSMKIIRHYGGAYARSIGAPDKDIITSLADETSVQLIGGKNLFEHTKRQTYAWGGEAVSRFNRLLELPFEQEPIATIFKKVQSIAKNKLGFDLQFSVPKGSGMKMLGDLGIKYGLKLGALGLAYQTADYAIRNTDLLNSTVFDEGLSTGIATAAINTSLFASRVAEATGLHSYREKQEEIAPGSTSLTKLLAVPATFALGAGVASYVSTVASMAKYQKQGMTASEARATAMRSLESFGTGMLADIGKSVTTSSGLYSRQDWVGKVFKNIATPDSTGELSFKFLGKMGPAKLASTMGAIIGLGLIAPFVPGALVPSERPKELEETYSGQKEVAIRKGRWWEFGRTPWEGQQIMYYRPHWYPRMMMRAREKSIYNEVEGEEESPVSKWFRREFTYDLEKEHYRDRPYPITSLPFEDVPLLGPLLANTVGRLIKPPRLMHTEEWINERGETITEPGAFGARIATEIGERPPAQPISPYDPRGTIGEQTYRMTEMAGLLGYAATSFKESLTGSQDLFDQAAQLESARRMFGAEREYWDLEIGGGLGTTEAYRRLIPHRRRQIELYNPIRNTMPNWLPGAGERGPDLQHGDPYASVQEGELRLPGIGYEARFPELKGIDPEDYPDIHKYKILADVAQHTNKFSQVVGQVESRRKSGDWSDYEENIYQQTREQLKAKKQRKDFSEYQYLSSTGGTDEDTYYASGTEDTAGLLDTINRAKASKKQEPSMWQKLFGGYWETLSHNIETPIDYLTPAAPAAKFMHERSAIENYELTQVYGTQNAFWNKPWENFMRPFLQVAARSFGFTDIPEPVEKKRELQEYFDILKYVKSSRLANEAQERGDFQAEKEFEQQKSETLFGLNPFTRNYTSTYRALPREERDYFSEFEKADTEAERHKILEMVPENEKGLYLARWKLQLAQDIKSAQKADILSEDQLAQAEETLEKIYEEARVEGFPYNEELFQQYTEEHASGESYGDWYRRTKILPQVPLPGPDWVGWHPSVDLEDIKLKVVTNLGEDMHNYNLWESRLKTLANKPYIDQTMIEPILKPQTDHIGNQQRINDIMLTSKVRGSIYSRPSFGQKDTYEVDLHQKVDLDTLFQGAL